MKKFSLVMVLSMGLFLFSPANSINELDRDTFKRMESATNTKSLGLTKGDIAKAISTQRKFAKKKKGVSTFNVSDAIGVWVIAYPSLEESSTRIMDIVAVEPNGIFRYDLYDSEAEFLTFGFGSIKGNIMSFTEPIVGGELLNVLSLSGLSGVGNLLGHISYDCSLPPGSPINTANSISCSLLSADENLFLDSNAQILKVQ